MSARIGLDNQAFAGRLRQARPRSVEPRFRPRTAGQGSMQRVARFAPATAPTWQHQVPSKPRTPLVATAEPKHYAFKAAITPSPAEQSTPAEPVTVYKPQPFAIPAVPKQQHSQVLKRQIVAPTKLAFNPPAQSINQTKPKRSKLQVALVGMAVFVFAVGIFASIQTILTNHTATAQVSALSKKADNQAAAGDGSGQVAAPSTTKPSASSIANYAVGPTMPRYLNIPELGVHARILSLGILSSGALATPNNVFDTGWYNESSLPGQPGAMLIDGHVSSWTTNGVFYGIKNLKPGDTMQVQRGDGTIFTYKVVRSQTFSNDNVDMTSALTSATAGKPGLNLITCTGKVKPGTNEFSQRVIVYAVQQ